MSILDEENQRMVTPRFLDLSGVHISTKEELQNIMFKMLEVRLRPDKLTEDEINRIIYCESSSPTAEYPFLDPIPASMRDVDLSELSQVDIDWKMLTLARPNTKQEMEIFTRFVELEKLKYKSLFQEDEKAEEIRVAAIKVKVQADGFEQETNSDEFTYEYFSRRLAVEEVPQSEDSSKKPPDVDKRKLSQKLDSVSRQETFPEPNESPSPIPDAELETKRQLSAKKKTKKLKKKKIRRRKRKRRIKRLKNGRVVFVITKRRKKWYSLKKKKRKKREQKEVPTSNEQEETNVIHPTDGLTGGEKTMHGDISKEIKDSGDVAVSEIKESSSSKPQKNKKSAIVSTLKKGKKTRKNNLSNVSKTNSEAPKSTTARKHINNPKHVKGVSSRVLAKRGAFTRSASVRFAKTAKITRRKISQKFRSRKEPATAKLDADGKGTEPADEIGKEERDMEENVSSAKLSSSAGIKMKVKNRKSLNTLTNANMDPKSSLKSPSEKPPSKNLKENNNDKADLT